MLLLIIVPFIYLLHIYQLHASSIYIGLTRNEKGEILGLNNGVIGGTNDELKQRIIGGETYGRLPSCPKCGQLTLKLKNDNPGIVVCSGTHVNKSDATKYRYCTYTEKSHIIERSGFWLGHCYFMKRIEENPSFKNEINLRIKFNSYINSVKAVQAKNI